MRGIIENKLIQYINAYIIYFVFQFNDINHACLEHTVYIQIILLILWKNQLLLS